MVQARIVRSFSFFCKLIFVRSLVSFRPIEAMVLNFMDDSNCHFGNERETGVSDLSQRFLGLYVPSNDPRNNCGTHFGSSSFFVSKAANEERWNYITYILHILT